MRIQSNKISDIISFFKKELIELYEEREINGFISLIMKEYTGLDKAQLLINENKTVSESVLLKIKFAINDLKIYKPIQYILGKTTFYDLDFILNSSVLIPRPETEELVDLIISTHKNDDRLLKIIDIGTGSGCIPVVLKKHLPNCQVLGVDISEDALKIAEVNSKNNNLIIEWMYCIN